MKKGFVFIIAIIAILSLAACGASDKAANNDVKLDMPAVYEKLTATVELPPMLELPEDLVLDLCGIKAEDVAYAKVEICEDSLRTDEIWLIEANDEDAAKTIEDLAQKRLKAKGEESITYSPEQYAVVEKAELIRTGKYVALFVSPDSAALAEIFRAEAGL